MATCVNIRRKHRKVCIGDLDILVKLQSRAITAPSSGVDLSETFVTTSSVWALVETVNGKSFFNDVGIEFNVTHHIYIIFIAGITDEDWIEFEDAAGDRRFDILDFEDLEERHEFLKLVCNDRGAKAKAAAEA